MSRRSASEGGGIAARVVMDHDEGIRAEGDYRFKNFTRGEPALRSGFPG